MKSGVRGDAILLDYLEHVHRVSGFQLCTMRMSSTGRGWRLHSADAPELRAAGESGFPTVRAAIKAALDKGVGI